MPILYTIFSGIDYAIYWMCKFVMKLIILIANYNFFGEEKISDLADRVYVILGVLVLFKIVISCVQYMVNPDTFDDKDKGMAGILKKAAISMVLLVAVRPIFAFAIQVQTSIVSTVPSLVMGTGSSNFTLSDSNAKKNLEDIGELVATSTLKAFVTVKTNANGSPKYKDEINSLDTFIAKITDGCGGFLGFGNTESCHYDYKWLISTAAGVFLLYILLSMALDIGIRSIKLGIIQILAPIPIGSYIVSKDKFDKFVKLSVKVYLDLFIRLIIVYFIIFFVKNIVESMGTASSPIMIGTSYKADSIEVAFIKVIVIIALFMFAKNAPKFICDVLGIDGGGFGDFGDMFKPQRLTGLAAGAINPIRNAASNVRDAWKNNADMIDGRGNKLRRVLQNARRVGNATRHGIGGLARGTFDAYAGTVAGEDWAKRNQRYKNAIAKSKKRTAEGFMKRTDNDIRLEYKDKREAIEKEFKARGIDLNKRMRKFRDEATDAVYNRIDSNNATIADLQHKIAEGKRTGLASSAEIMGWEDRLREVQAEQALLSTKSGFDDAVSKEIENKKRTLVQEAVDQRVASVNNKMNENARRMNALLTTLSDPGLTAEQRAKAEETYVQLKNENAELVKEIDPAAQEKLATKYAADLDEQIKIVTDELDKERNISNWTIAKGKLDEAFGGSGFTGTGYTNTADLLKNNRSSLYTGEAMTKMRQNADVLVDSSGNAAKFTAKFTMPSAGKVELTYAEIADLKKKVDNGTIKEADLQAKGFENGAMLQSAFEDLEKQAAEAYVTANMAAADPSVHSKFGLKKGYEPNSTIVEGIKRMKSSLAVADISKEEREKLLKELSENPGQFFKKASDTQEHLRTKGSRISAYNSGKKDSGS